MQIFQTLDTQYPVTSYKLKQWVVIYMVNFQEQGQLEKLAGWEGGKMQSTGVSVWDAWLE